MNSISEQILNAIDLVTEEKLSHLQYDKTVKGEIYSLEDINTGEYKVRYQGTIFSAYSENLDTVYKDGDSVFIKVPEGDFSNRKIISGLVSGTSLSDTQLTMLANTIKEISPPFNEFYGYNIEPEDNEEWGVVAGATEASAGSELYIYGPTDYSSSIAHDRFKQYSNNYEYIRIQASFLTAFHQIHTQGNYGLEIEFFTNDENTTVRYILDLNSFNGDPYALSTYSPQEVIIKTQKNYLQGLRSIKLFEENFIYDTLPTQDGTEEEIVTTPNIFVKNINLQYVERVDLTDTTYYLTISPIDGNAFTSETSSLEFRGQLIYQGKNILNNSTCVCSWFKRDLSVAPGTIGYDKDVGFGWAPLESSPEETISSDGSILTLTNSSSINHQEEYKLKVVYNGRVTSTASIEVFNLTNSYDYHLEQVTTSDNIELQLINDNSTEELSGVWYYSYPDGTYLVFDGSNKHTFIEIKDKLLYSRVDFFVTVYQGEKKLGTLSHIILNSESENDLIVTYNGDDNFKYDANGDISIEDAEKDRTMTISLAWKAGVGTSYNVEWYMRQSVSGGEIAIPTSYAHRIDPELSMLDDVWLDTTQNLLHYHIKQKYKTNLLNNSFILKIITLDEQVYTFEKEILFLKDGDQGTNGTTYIASVRPADEAGLKLSGFQSLHYNATTGQWGNDLFLHCYVYKNGEIITNGENNYSINFRWQGTNVLVNGEDSLYEDGLNQVTVSAQAGAAANIERYVSVQITIKDNLNDRSNVIYTHYPIDVRVDSTDYEIDPALVDINDIPSYIKYTSTGVIPSTSSGSVFFKYNNLVYKNTEFNTPITSINTRLLTITNDSYMNPATSFVFEQAGNTTIGLVSCRIDAVRYIVHSIVMYLDTYGNEAISGWDGTSIRTEDGQIFAPQVGAGEKDSQNKFTGVVMGKDSGQDQIGLYGYQGGVNTFGLQQDGTAYFGAKNAGGRINFDGRYAYIYGGDTIVDKRGKITYAENGMALILADKSTAEDEDQKVQSTTVAIAIGKQEEENKGVFEVTYGGALIATSADITGAIYASSGRIGGTARNGGWVIENNNLYSGSSDTYVGLNSGQVQTPTLSVSSAGIIKKDTENLTNDYARIWAGSQNVTSAKFYVTQSGQVYMKAAYIDGIINSTEGQIGGWKITNRSLINTTSDRQVGVSVGATSGNATRLVFWSGKISNVTVQSDDSVSLNTSTLDNTGEQEHYFYVTTTGQLYCKNADVQGKITANDGKIGGWEIKQSRLQNSDGDVYISASGGAQFGNNFRISSSGILSANDADISGTITANSGSIGNWSIDSGAISNSTTILGANGTIIANYYQSGTDATDGNGYVGNLSKAPSVSSDAYGIYGHKSAAVIAGDGPLTIRSNSSNSDLLIQGYDVVRLQYGAANSTNPHMILKSDGFHFYGETYGVHAYFA